MKRREMLLTTGAAIVGLSAFPFGLLAADKKQKVLYFSRSAGYEHPPVTRKGDELSPSEKALMKWGKEAGIEVVCTKDGAVFDGDLDQYDAFVFYTSGVLTDKCNQPGSPMSKEGKQKFLDAIKAGKGFVGIHSSTDCFHSDGVDPYIGMIGGEFIIHGAYQKAKMKVTSPKFPGLDKMGDEFAIEDEWYSQNKFPKDLHVIFVQETGDMQGDVYKRPPYPATWARNYGKGRVFYTSMGHDGIWQTPTFKQVLMSGINWALGNVDADVTPNIEQVTPEANVVPKK
jgi:uncharacterized protein